MPGPADGESAPADHDDGARTVYREPAPGGYDDGGADGYDVSVPAGYDEPAPDGTPGYADGSPDGYADSSPDGYADSSPDGYADSSPDGYADSSPDGYADSSPDGYADGSPGYADGSPDGYADGSPDGYAEGAGRHWADGPAAPGRHEGTAHYSDRDGPAAAYPDAAEPGYGTEDPGYDRQAMSEAFGYRPPAGPGGYSHSADMPAYRDPGDEDGYIPGAGAAYDGPGDAGAEERLDEAYTYREPAHTLDGEPTEPGRSDPPSPRSGDDADDPAAYFSGLDEPAAYAGEPAAYAGEPAAYAGEPAAYAGEPAAYAGEPAAYAGEPAAYAGEPAAFAGRPPGNVGTPDPGPSPAHDDGAEPAPYVAPNDPNTGADTEPFRGPFEPHPAQPKLSDYQPTGPPPAALASSGEAPASPADAGPQPDGRVPGGRVPGRRVPGGRVPGRRVPGGRVPGGRVPDAWLPNDDPRIDVPVRPGAVSLDTEEEPDRDGSQEKLEKIKDLYLTVEAIGDDNVDKHFDELLQRQRELISDYFKGTGIGTGTARVSQPDQPGQADQPVITDRDPRSN